MSVDYQLPALPFGSSEMTILRWFPQTGTSCAIGAPFLIVVNDQVEVALPAPTNCTLEHILINEGETTTAGTIIAHLVPAQAGTITPPQVISVDLSQSIHDTRFLITPAAQRVADELRVDLQQVTGTGPSGRIMKRDVLAVNGHVPEVPQADERPQLHVSTPIAVTTIAPAVLATISSPVPYALTTMKIDLSSVAAYLATHTETFSRRGLALSYTSCIGQALVLALLQYPLLNSTWNDSYIMMRKRIHLAIGIQISNGSFAMPVIHDAQDLNLKGLTRAFTQLTGNTYTDVLPSNNLDDHTFTLLSSYNSATWFSTALPHQQHGNRLHIGRVQTKPHVMNHTGDDRIVMIPTTLLTLIYDVRTINQHESDHFLNCVQYQVEHFAE